MKVIAITLPDVAVGSEAERITAMLESGSIDRVHIRKPGMTAEDMRALISSLPIRLHGRLSIHSNPSLLNEFPGLGWHFSSMRPDKKCRGSRSRSCHSPAEAAEWAAKCDYVTLSPVFDSISKPGYTSACFDPEEEYSCNQQGLVVALGGVTPEKFPGLKERGYTGAAMLGYAWTTELNKLIQEIRCYNS